MKINGVDTNVDDLVNKLNLEDNFMHDRGNGIYLSNNQIEVLKRNGIDYKKFSSLASLIFELDEIINSDEFIDEELDSLLNDLSEINYYKNTNK